MKALLFLFTLTFGAVGALYQVDGAPWLGAAPSLRPAGEPRHGGDMPVAEPAVLADGGASLAAEQVQMLHGEIIARPLFARTRRPGDDKAPQAEIASDGVFATPRARLLGVYIAPPVRRVLLRFADGDPEWLNEGATSRGWTVKAVSPGEAVIVGSAGELTLDLHAPQP